MNEPGYGLKGLKLKLQTGSTVVDILRGIRDELRLQYTTLQPLSPIICTFSPSLPPRQLLYIQSLC